MNNTMKIFLAIGIILYALSPIDLCPGPIDDAIAIVIGIIAARRKLNDNTSYYYE